MCRRTWDLTQFQFNCEMRGWGEVPGQDGSAGIAFGEELGPAQAALGPDGKTSIGK